MLFTLKDYNKKTGAADYKLLANTYGKMTIYTKQNQNPLFFF
jgi:hypothetical protein